MNLAIFHYHLNRGGVARGIENHLRALDAALDPAESWRVALVHGGRRLDWDETLAGRLQSVRLATGETPWLDYDEWHAAEPARHGEQLGRDVRAALGRLGFRREDTLLHFHNHALGKNRAVPGLIASLVAEGYAALLQIHDFAEDFRPANYQRLASVAASSTWYPQAPAIHYAVLNDRDHAILRAAGVEADRLHLLPNPVPALGVLPSREAARAKLKRLCQVDPRCRLLLYPVRAIRRKNIGEAMLCALLAGGNTVVGIALPAQSAGEKPSYEAWQRAAGALNLPCRFDLGVGGMRFLENLAASDAILTTSVAEGFGMVFLESWLAGRPLVGRDLPDVTADFRRRGLRLDGLWTRLDVPIDAIGRDRYVRTAVEQYRRALAAYGAAAPADLEDQLSGKIINGMIDFADFDEAMQRDVLAQARDDRPFRQRVEQANPLVAAALGATAESAVATIAENIAVIEREYSAEAVGRRLLGAYRDVAAAQRGGPVVPLDAAHRILEAFVSPGRFRLLRG